MLFLQNTSKNDTMDNPDNNIVFAEPGNYTLTIDGDAITIVKN